MNPPQRAGAHLLAASELLLAAVGAAAVAGFARIFEEGSFFAPVALSLAASHLIAAVTRRHGLGIIPSAAISAIGLALVTTWVHYWSTIRLGLPSTETLRAIDADASVAWERFQEVVAPAPTETGFLVALGVAAWIAAFLADWAAFRLWAPLEAIVPASALFVFGALLGADQHRLEVTAGFMAAVFGFEVTFRVLRQSSRGAWIAVGSATGNRALLAAGATLSSLSVVFALVAGPALPGADEPAIVSWRELDQGPGSRVTLSPMVDIRSRLVEQRDVEVFTVEATAPAYWRLTSLDTFDGRIWKSRGNYRSVGADLPGDSARASSEITNVQRYTIRALDALWLPAAFEPRRVDAPSIDVVYESASATLIVGSDLDDSDGVEYTIESTLPAFTSEELDLATATPPPPEITDRYLDLPPNFSRLASRIAEDVTANAASDYDRALALQAFFRESFTYNVEIDAGHGIQNIDRFLEAREGYCEQFAGTYAAMARSLGIPARVAVGFTPGERDASNPNLYHVTGRHAHAWPEVYLGSAGWVAFEPTPGRGAPGAEAYTGVAPQQDTSTGGAEASETTTSEPPTSTTAPPSPGGPDADELAELLGTSETGDGAQASSQARWPDTLARLAVTLALGVVAYAASVVLAKAVAARRRRGRILGGRRGEPPPREEQVLRARVRLAWEDAVEHLALAGIAVRASDTQAEVVERALAATGLDPGALRTLGRVAAASSYAPSAPPIRDVEAAEQAAEMVRMYAVSMTPFRRRLAHLLDPRPFLPSTPRLEAGGRLRPRTA